jgi:hypothetical protein
LQRSLADKSNSRQAICRGYFKLCCMTRRLMKFDAICA